ncbi:hypothetical protein NX059_002000 [Plenodomus lindquistii]|nr:hypothetical protein NX059_002000 [Plenodomus lindquistii]
MTPYNDDQLNMNSLLQDNSHDFNLEGTMGLHPFNLGRRTFGNLYKDDNRAFEVAYNMMNPAHTADDDLQSGWASDVAVTMPDIGEYSNPGASSTGDVDTSSYAFEASGGATFADLIGHSQDTPVTDGIYGKDASSVKVEQEDDDDNFVSSLPSQSGEYDEYVQSDESDGGYFEGSRTNTTPKTNKDGGRRKPRQPRAKLLKWNDNDWKNVVLGIIWACGETGTQIPFDQASQIVGETCTAGALQQAVLKLRQKQVAEGNWIPPLKMAWTRKSKTSDSAVMNADNAKVLKAFGKGKSPQAKNKPTRFSGNQSRMHTFKRAYVEADRAHLPFPYAPASQSTNVFKAYVPSGEQTPIQKRRHALQVSLTGSPHRSDNPLFEELYVDTEKARVSNRNATVNDGFLFQTIARGNHINHGNAYTPNSTPGSVYHAQLGTPGSFAAADEDSLDVMTGPLVYTPCHTPAAAATAQAHLQSRALNPQGSPNYTMVNTATNPTLLNTGMYNNIVHGSQFARQVAMMEADNGHPDDIF